MLLSVIIPVYNEELTIGNIIDRVTAVVQQTGLKNEVIVVDDCSYDKSLEIAKKHDAKTYTLKRHLGKGYALRAGFAQAKGDVVVTIDSDGSHKPEELSLVLALILQTKQTSSSAQDTFVKKTWLPENLTLLAFNSSTLSSNF